MVKWLIFGQRICLSKSDMTVFFLSLDEWTSPIKGDENTKIDSLMLSFIVYDEWTSPIKGDENHLRCKQYDPNQWMNEPLRLKETKTLHPAPIVGLFVQMNEPLRLKETKTGRFKIPNAQQVMMNEPLRLKETKTCFNCFHCCSPFCRMNEPLRLKETKTVVSNLSVFWLS